MTLVQQKREFHLLAQAVIVSVCSQVDMAEQDVELLSKLLLSARKTIMFI